LEFRCLHGFLAGVVLFESEKRGLDYLNVRFENNELNILNWKIPPFESSRIWAKNHSTQAWAEKETRSKGVYSNI
jgi:hypothetical protein